MTDTPDLDEWLIGDEPDLDYDREPEPLGNPEQTDRAFSRLHRARRMLAEYDADAERLTVELRDRIDRRRTPLVERVGYWERALQLTHQALLAQDPTRTRVTYPSGTLTSRAQAPEWEWPTPATPEWAALVEWVEANAAGAYKVPPTPPPTIDKNALKAAVKASTLTKRGGETVPRSEGGAVVTADGETVPGVRVIARPRTFAPEPAGLD